MKKNKYLETGLRGMCYGCKACAHFCPTNAITMIKDERGFSFPRVDLSKCVECGKCNNVCPIEIKKNKYLEIYQAYHKNEQVVISSQSGGMFTAFSDYILENDGSVYGVSMSNDFSIIYTRATSKSERDAMHGSKYVEGIFDLSLFDLIEHDLNDGKLVLFVGTPCQSAAIKKNYGRYSNLYVIDFICHGKPSHSFWESYIESKKKQFGDIKTIVFRLKQRQNKGWSVMSMLDSSGITHFLVDYYAFFYWKYAHRESCFSCQFASTERCSDITIGGYLEKEGMHVPYDDSSMLLINSPKGKQLFEKIYSHIVFEESKIAFYKSQPCLYKPVQKPEKYDEFWEDFIEGGFDRIMKNAESKYDFSNIIDKYHLFIKCGND